MRRGLFVLLLGVSVVILCWHAVSRIVNTRRKSMQEACINNLRQITAGKDSFALEQGKTNGWMWSSDVAAFSHLVDNAAGYIKDFPLCPCSTTTIHNASQAATDYRINPIGIYPECRVNPGSHRLSGSVHPGIQPGERALSEGDFIASKAIGPYKAKSYSELVALVGKEPTRLDLDWSCSQPYEVAVWTMWQDEKNGNVVVMVMVSGMGNETRMIPCMRSFAKTPGNEILLDQTE